MVELKHELRTFNVGVIFCLVHAYLHICEDGILDSILNYEWVLGWKNLSDPYLNLIDVFVTLKLNSWQCNIRIVDDNWEQSELLSLYLMLNYHRC